MCARIVIHKMNEWIETELRKKDDFFVVHTISICQLVRKDLDMTARDYSLPVEQSAANDAPPSVLPRPTAETTHKRSHSISVIDADRPFKVIIFQKNSAPEECKTELPSSCQYDESFHLTPIKHHRSFSRCLHMSFSSATKFSKLPRPESLGDKRYDSFKTWTGKTEKSISEDPAVTGEGDSFPAVKRYFDALKGPDLDTLRVSIRGADSSQRKNMAISTSISDILFRHVPGRGKPSHAVENIGHISIHEVHEH
ncbi:S-type anion channel SLAH3 [Platanthera guangdongensis]|uniref:S-type anion channel SLAH3 n=1 Tax=Platanthera guangdongensis TaxID=2320717 RepID=A0ABR2N0P6_9ASPA